MVRLARVVVPGMPHHVTQRGNRRMQTFFCDEDYRAYLSLMVEWCGRHGVAIWTYCLMPNHVHLILVPPREDAMARAVGEAHRRYTRRVNFREGWRGHLWQERFASFVMDERYLPAAARYVEMNLPAGRPRQGGPGPASGGLGVVECGRAHRRARRRRGRGGVAGGAARRLGVHVAGVPDAARR